MNFLRRLLNKESFPTRSMQDQLPPQDLTPSPADEKREAPPKQVEYVLSEEFEYVCGHCGAKGERYEQVYSEGKCSSCGAGATSKREVVSSQELVDPDHTILTIYGSDGEEQAKEFMAMAKSQSVPVADYKDFVTNGMSRGQKNELAFQLARKCGRTLIFVSEKLTMEQGKLATSAFEAQDYMPPGAIKIIPVLINKNSLKHLPYDRDGLQCIAWSEEVNLGIAESRTKVSTSSKNTVIPWLKMFKSEW